MNNVKRYIKILALFSIGLIIFFSLPSLCTGHDSHKDHHHDHHHHHQHGDDDHHESAAFKYSKEANTQFTQAPTAPKKADSVSSLWIEALSANLIISLAPFFILFFVPVNSRHEGGPLLKIMLSFAAGGLLGDAFLHLIPHALEPHAPGAEHDHHSHDHSHDGEHSHHHSNTGPWVLAGLFMFFIVDKCMRSMKLAHDHSHGDERTDVTAKKEQEKDTDDEKKKEIDNADAMSESDGNRY